MVRGLMPASHRRNALFSSAQRPVIWLDVEMCQNDSEPALTSVHWLNGLQTYVHDPILIESAKARNLEFQPWAQLAADIVAMAISTKSVVSGYSLHERNLLRAACPADAEWIDANYGNANLAKWFKKNRPQMYAEACRAAGEGQRPGLKDFLIQPAVGYPFKKYLRTVQPASILRRLRKLLDNRNGTHRDLTNEAKQDWGRLIEYNREDVLGMIHLVEYVRTAD